MLPGERTTLYALNFYLGHGRILSDLVFKTNLEPVTKVFILYYVNVVDRII